ncbi:MAG: hypothetical protein ACHP7N_10280 [Caulobacterales bacterium]
MFKTIDVLIGFTLVMLVVSMAVTTLTQVVMTAINLRGQALRGGITELLRLLDRGIHRQEAGEIADHILRDPLVAQPGLLPGKRHLAPVILREELTKLLLVLGADPQEYEQTPRTVYLSQARLDALRATLRASLDRNGIGDADATLRQVRTGALELEKSNPELSNSVRMNSAILSFASSDFTGKLNAWFDQTIDRVSDAFALHARVVAVVVAAIVALALQLDSFAVINRLSTDEALRSQAVKWSIDNQSALATAVTPNAGVTAATQTPAPAPPTRKHRTVTPTPIGGGAAQVSTLSVSGSQSPPADVKATADLINRELTETQIVDVPAWSTNWADDVKIISSKNPLGILLSVILLSLGAPFWFETLKNLLKLRSVVATKDDQQRQERQSSQTSPAAPGQPDAPGAPGGPAPYSPLLGGEKGDLAAIG